MNNKLTIANDNIEKLILEYTQLITEYDQVCQTQNRLALKKLKLARKCTRLKRCLIHYHSGKEGNIETGNFSLKFVTTGPILEIYDIHSLPEEFLVKQNETRIKKGLLRSKLIEGQVLPGAKIKYTDNVIVKSVSKR